MQPMTNENNTEKGFQELYTKHHGSIYRHLLFLTGEPPVAEDLTQETFLRLYNTPPPDFTFIGAWLSRVASNLAINYFRSEKSRCKRDHDNYLKEMPLKVVSIEDAFWRTQVSREVREVLKDLPERDRICLLLKHSGYSYKEISDTTGIDEKTVGSVLHRATRKFKDSYMQKKGSVS